MITGDRPGEVTGRSPNKTWVLGGDVSTKARSPGDTSLMNPVEVANWTKFTGMVPPIIGSTFHFGSWQYDVIADNSG